MSLRDRVVLITGGTSGIGRASAAAFAAAGAKVVIAGRDEARGERAVAELHAAGAGVRFVRCDVASSTDVTQLIGEVVAIFGRLDIAFNNAATEDGAFARTAEFSEDDYDRALGANLKGVWLCMRAEIQQMLRQTPSGGVILNTSSVNGLGGAPGGALYSAAKAGVLALTKSAALEYATQGIRVNALVAGAFGTPMLDRVFDRAAPSVPNGRDGVRALYIAQIPQQRIGHPDEAAEVALWLCSDAASYVTGHSMIVDGGMTASVR